ncbi:hypothetical protein HS7_19650 [Sulfolobales archaeon HS-7]|nr:hypothetical protein HS7_19650 [Sulfolobales archaeon HS-7]
MANVLVTIRIAPESDKVDLDDVLNEIRGKLPKEYSIVSSEKQPIAFGIEALVVNVVMPENTEGGTDVLEELLMGVQGVGGVEVENVSRLGF